MANIDAPHGLKPARYLSGAPWNGALTKYSIPAAATLAVGKGDIVKLTGAGTADGLREVAAITATTDVPVGVAVGFLPDPSNLNLAGTYRPASAQSADRVVLVCDDPNVLFESQEDGDGGAVAVASLGLNVAPTVTTPSTTTGVSTMEIDSSTVTTLNTALLRLHEFVQAPDNTPASANARFLVSFNAHQYKAATGSTGI